MKCHFKLHLPYTGFVQHILTNSYQQHVSFTELLLFLSNSVSALLNPLHPKSEINKSLTTQIAGFYMPASSISRSHCLVSDNPV